MNKYIPVIGLEVHIELNTKSKMFCTCDNNWFGAKPNTHTCPVCLGLPGALPVPNKKAIESCIKIGLALNCKISLLSKFDRKNYFYPDLAKGYQISQYDQPFSQNGYIILRSGKRIGIRRAHMEEDTGKLMHATIEPQFDILKPSNVAPLDAKLSNGEKVSLIDFNRSGVPLVEIVTEPEFESAEEVKEYLQKLQQIVRYLGVSDADMEKGGMRLEPNISLRKYSPNESPRPLGEGQDEGRSFDLPNYKVEVKNINSFNFVAQAIEYEIQRQSALLDEGERPAQETRGWDEDKKKTISQRSKEEAADYRYFPEPDIPPFVWTNDYIENLKKELPELPDFKKARFVSEFGLSEYNAEQLIRTKELADYFEECIHATVILGTQSEAWKTPESGLKKDSGQARMTNVSPTDIANWIINRKININEILPAQLIQQIVKATQVSGISEVELESVLKKVLEQNQQVATEYKNGKTNAIMFLVGRAMKELKGKTKAETVKQTLEHLLQKE